MEILNQNDIQKLEVEIAEVLKIKSCFFEYLRSDGWHPLKFTVLLHYIKGSSNGLTITLRISDSEFISRFNITEFPGCCGICISTGVIIDPKYRGKGLNIILNKFRILIAKLSGYTIMMCTDLDNNAPQRKTLIKNGWKDIYQFKNKRTGNLLNLSLIEL